MIICKKNGEELELYDFVPNIAKIKKYRESIILKLDSERSVYTAITNKIENEIVLQYSHLIPFGELNKSVFDDEIRYHQFKNYIPSTYEWEEILKRLINKRTLGNRIVFERVDDEEKVIKYLSLLEPSYKWKLGGFYVMDDIIEIPMDIYYLDRLMAVDKVTNIDFNILKYYQLDLFKLDLVEIIPFSTYNIMQKCGLLKIDGMLQCSERLFKILDSRR